MHRILVVEDEEFLSKVMADKLKKEGFEVFVANNGEEGVALAKEHKPDVMLLDLIMPQKNGFEVLEELRADPSTRDTKVIILSNLGQPDDIEKGKALGAVDYFIKADTPIYEVVKIINKHL